MTNNKNSSKTAEHIRWSLVGYDLIVFILTCWFMFVFYKGNNNLSSLGVLVLSCIAGGFSFASRFIFKVYSQVWRYGGIQSYIKLITADAIAFPFFYFTQRFLAIENINFPMCLSAACVNLLGALCMRMIYRYAYKYGNENNALSKFLRVILSIFTFGSLKPVTVSDSQKIKAAIIGAGSIGSSLAEELKQSAAASYMPVCFVDTDKDKIGREIHGMPVLAENDEVINELDNLGVQQVIFALPSTVGDRKKELYALYKRAGYQVKLYDYPSVENVAGSKRSLREFDPEELLFRKLKVVVNDKTKEYYRDKVILITGGGGSIGSELCRQIAKLSPKQLIILDIYENGAYDVQQELKIAYDGQIDVKVEIVSVVNRAGLERVFAEYRPQLVLNAAAHKHVPLMEKNCIEAVENNVFGTLNTVELSEKYAVERVIMISTDKAVNPTNIMGATKRMCELIVQSHSAVGGKTTFSTTRFGNVLGSAGSVIPLFKKQIAHGGPVTVTDKRIIRYFMTIPEASQLVLTSSAMAKNGDLFVLDMGNPIRIYDLAENMIRLSGLEPDVDINIVETGLRPGEKLYEELLVKSENLTKTDNDLIFVEHDTPISSEDLSGRLNTLKEAIKSDSDAEVRKALSIVVPTFKKPEIVNAAVKQEK